MEIHGTAGGYSLPSNVTVSFDPTADFGDRTERLFTYALDFTMNEFVGGFVQIPHEALAVKFRFHTKGLNPTEEEPLKGGLTGIQELEAS